MKDGHGKATVSFTQLEPGTYEVRLSGRTAKTGGYWFGTTEDVVNESGYWSKVELHPTRVTVTIPG
ncbi:hypothetical protein ACFYYB_26960 [Streptomyces sp. NPDC002886]|uniref:hypothetical protein n=1 Tax=Streptomyces sp. NPDC002886 TaxID=3364667 RepID=UPI0036ADCB73